VPRNVIEERAGINEDDLFWNWSSNWNAASFSKTGQVRQEVAYGVTSLRPDEAGPEQLLQINRDYWGIENGLHYRRDKPLREDATRTSNPTLAEAVAILNNLVIGLALHQGWRYLPNARRHFNANLQDALNLVLRRPT